ncbi:MAG: hypothetical protein ACPGYL_14990, partial [Rhodospirillaceae bacterium]
MTIHDDEIPTDNAAFEDGAADAPEGTPTEDTPSDVTPEPSPNPESFDASADADSDTPETADTDTLELDLGGTKHRLDREGMTDETVEKVQSFAKSLQTDYTRKTQEVAEQRRDSESALKEAQTLSVQSEEKLFNLASVLSIQSNLENMQARLTPALWQSDPNTARRLSDQIQHSKSVLQAQVIQANQIEHHLSVTAAQSRTEAAERGKAYIARHAKDFDEAALVQFAIDNGIPEQNAKNWALSPSVTLMVHDAMKYRAQQAKARKQAKRKAAAPLPDPRTAAGDKLPIETWMKLRYKSLNRPGPG